MDIFNKKKLNQKRLDKIELTKIILWSANPKINVLRMDGIVNYRDLVIDNKIYVDEDEVVVKTDIGFDSFERVSLSSFFEKIKQEGISDLTIDNSSGDVLVY